MIELDHVTKVYGRFTAVHDLPMSVGGGEIFGLLGENGAGKTTVLRMISTVLSPTAGTIRVCGNNVAEQGTAARRCMGVVASEVGAYDRLTVSENLTYFGRLYRVPSERLSARVNEVLDLVHLSDDRGKLAGQLSKGTKQKLAIGRALLHDPAVLVMDEPMTGLDVGAQQAIRLLMEQLKGSGKTILFSSHNMADVDRLCDRVGIIAKGRLVACGPVSRLVTDRQAQGLEELILSLQGVAAHVG